MTIEGSFKIEMAISGGIGLICLLSGMHFIVPLICFALCGLRFYGLQVYRKTGKVNTILGIF